MRCVLFVLYSVVGGVSHVQRGPPRENTRNSRSVSKDWGAKWQGRSAYPPRPSARASLVRRDAFVSMKGANKMMLSPSYERQVLLETSEDDASILKTAEKQHADESLAKGEAEKAAVLHASQLGVKTKEADNFSRATASKETRNTAVLAAKSAVSLHEFLAAHDLIKERQVDMETAKNDEDRQKAIDRLDSARADFQEKCEAADLMALEDSAKEKGDAKEKQFETARYDCDYKWHMLRWWEKLLVIILSCCCISCICGIIRTLCCKGGSSEEEEPPAEEN